ncbi:MAG: glycosyl hydrolase family 65 protein [Anaerolineales bacterium]|jgi:cellobiose phosphorylase
MRYGFFDELRREYVITDPHTPVKWINYIGTRSFGGFVDHTGGALICKDDPTFNRITKYIQQMPSSDFKGETLYLRVPGAGGYSVLAPFFVPGLGALERFECHVGLGYMRIVTECQSLRTDCTIFVPLGANCELRDIQVTNLRPAPVAVDAIPVVEYTHPDALRQFTNADWVPQTMQSRAVRDGDLLTLVQSPFMYRDTRVNYFTSNLQASSFETDRTHFLGDNEYGTFRAPRSLLQPELSNSLARRGDNLAALLVPLGTLQPGETRRLITQLGQCRSVEEALPEIRRSLNPNQVEAELGKLKSFWEQYLSALQVDTPDPSTNAMLNVYNPRQCYVTMTWSRYLSYFQLGLGSRGIGLRDSSQDVLAVMASLPTEARAFLLTLLSFQRPDGSALHQFNPLSGEASCGDALERPDRLHYYSDDHLWTILAVTAYLKETGDFSLMEEMVPFHRKEEAGSEQEAATVLEHMRRGLAFTAGDVGQHGLPLLGFADWNDTVNLPAGSESLFAANLYGKALKEMIALLEHLGESALARAYQAAYEQMRSRVEATAWDGDWYVRYFDETGKPLGSSKDAQAQIYLNAQSWPVISGFASRERARQAMDAVYRLLNTRYGIKLAAPSFNGYDPRYGGVTTFPPGTKENGGIFLHPNAWAVIAETLLGNGARAYQYYCEMNPAQRNETIETYECEPYVYAQNILSDEHPQFGLGRNSWLTGTASWAYQAATQNLLGIRPGYEGLEIDPCIPHAWNGFRATRRFRGSLYEISVENPAHVTQGVLSIRVDGRPVEGNEVPWERNPGRYQVQVRMGAAAESR